MTTIQIPDPVARRLKALAQRRGLEPGDLVGLMLDETDLRQEASAHDRLKDFCGVGTSGRPDVSARVDHYLAEGGYGQ